MSDSLAKEKIRQNLMNKTFKNTKTDLLYASDYQLYEVERKTNHAKKINKKMLSNIKLRRYKRKIINPIPIKSTLPTNTTMTHFTDLLYRTSHHILMQHPPSISDLRIPTPPIPANKNAPTGHPSRSSYSISA